MEQKRLNILIVGNSIPLAKKLSSYDNVENVFMTSSKSYEGEFYIAVDYREDDLTSLLKFVLEHGIDLTIPVCELALKNDIVEFFQSNGQAIFGPSAQACEIATSKILGKKFLHKIHAQTSKFGFFDKLQNAQKYLQEIKFPVLIRTNEVNSTGDRLVCPTTSLASEFLYNLYSKGEVEVLIEEFYSGHNFTVYFITDGYSAIPFSTVANYKFCENGDAGIYTNGVGCYVLDNKVSGVVIDRITNILNKTLETLDNSGNAYMGIIGVEATLTKDDLFVVNDFKFFMQDYDSDAVLSTVEENLVEVFMACVQGLFSDEYEIIKTNDLSSVSVVVESRLAGQIVSGLDDIDEVENLTLKPITGGYLTQQKGSALIITRSASTLSRAVKKVYSDLEDINFKGMKYRKDIGRTLINDDIY